MKFEYWMRNGGSSYWYRVSRELYEDYLTLFESYSKPEELAVTLAAVMDFSAFSAISA